MGNPFHSKANTLPEHLSDQGDKVFAYINIDVEMEDGSQHRVQLVHFQSGAMAVYGLVKDEDWMLAMLDNARDVINGYHIERDCLIVPGKDIDIGKPASSLKITGPIDNKEWTLSMIDCAKTNIRDHHRRRRDHQLIIAGNSI